MCPVKETAVSLLVPVLLSSSQDRQYGVVTFGVVVEPLSQPVGERAQLKLVVLFRSPLNLLSCFNCNLSKVQVHRLGNIQAAQIRLRLTDQ